MGISANFEFVETGKLVIWEYVILGIWEFGNTEIREYGNMVLWEYGNIGIWDFGNLYTCVSVTRSLGYNLTQSIKK